jgi:hypothetical protein
MATPSCPFHVECRFHNLREKTPSDQLLGQLYCFSRYDTCCIARRMLERKPVPVGACPDGVVKG